MASRVHPGALGAAGTKSPKPVHRRHPAAKAASSGGSSPHPKTPEMLLGVRSLLDEGKKVWLLDQYGVLHDGANAYPAAIEATRELHASGAKLFIISNSSRRSGKTLKKLEPMGYDPEWFSGVITSGEITHRKLSVVGTDEDAVDDLPPDATANERLDATFAALGDRCVHFTWSTRGSIPLDGLDLRTVVDVDDADFVLAHGTETINGAGTSDAERAEGAEDVPIERMRTILERAASRGLPLVVANPDIVTVGGESGLLPMPGTLAKWYASMPGHGAIHLMGKPSAVIYETIMEMTGTGREETVAVGDSLEHDVAGARAAGVDCVFVCGGIHAEELGMNPAELTAEEVGDGSGVEPPEVEAVERLAEEFEATPTHAVPVFAW